MYFIAYIDFLVKLWYFNWAASAIPYKQGPQKSQVSLFAGNCAWVIRNEITGENGPSFDSNNYLQHSFPPRVMVRMLITDDELHEYEVCEHA